jgi:hypothetical protein
MGFVKMVIEGEAIADKWRIIGGYRLYSKNKNQDLPKLKNGIKAFLQNINRTRLVL